MMANNTNFVQNFGWRSIEHSQFPFCMFKNYSCHLYNDSYIYIQRDILYELFYDDFCSGSEVKCYADIPIYYMYSIHTDQQWATRFINLQDELNNYCSIKSINQHPYSTIVRNHLSVRSDFIKTGHECVTLLDYFKIPKRSATYKIWMEYCGLKSNISEITILYRPYPRDIYAGS